MVDPSVTALLESFNAKDWWDFFTGETAKEVTRLKDQLGKRSETKTLEEVRYLQGRRDALEQWVNGFAERHVQRIAAAAARRGESG